MRGSHELFGDGRGKKRDSHLFSHLRMTHLKTFFSNRDGRGDDIFEVSYAGMGEVKKKDSHLLSHSRITHLQNVVPPPISIPSPELCGEG